ncbi:MAG: hypothetical protein AAGF24_00265 [Cyanobacteria bacterium P01_H01_bin.121]
MNKIVRFWIVCFLIVFGLAEGFDWLRELTIPMPIFILSGACLAFLSNYGKRFAFWSDWEQPQIQDHHAPTSGMATGASPPRPPLMVQKLPQALQRNRPISFTLRKSKPVQASTESGPDVQPDQDCA